MKFWNYIGEFFLFRWLFDKLHSPERDNDVLTNGNSDISDEESRIQSVNDSDDADYIHNTITIAGDNYDGDYDESDNLDDLDIFMRYNSVIENCNNSFRSGNYSNNHYWDSGNYDQSFVDFHEEQYDYDMMDDF